VCRLRVDFVPIGGVRATLPARVSRCRAHPSAPMAPPIIVASIVAAGISTDELRERGERLRALVADHDPSGFVVFDQSYIST
jgi:hypothetical protein